MQRLQPPGDFYGLGVVYYECRGIHGGCTARVDVGSDGSAAGGGKSDLSEWPRSAGDAGVRAKETAGHRNSRVVQ